MTNNHQIHFNVQVLIPYFSKISLEKNVDMEAMKC